MSFKTKKIFLLTIFVLLFGMIACEYSEEFTKVSVNNQYEMAFPAYMEAAKKGKELSPDASLTYLNYFRNIYTIVIDKPKGNTPDELADFYETEKGKLIKQLMSPVKIDSIPLKINGLAGFQTNIMGTVKGAGNTDTKIYYRLVFLESSTHLYQITLWTWYDWRQKYEGVMDRIVGSFGEQ